MKRLSKDDQKRQQELANQLDKLKGELEDALSEYNTAVRGAWEAVEVAMEAYNDACGEAEGFRDDITGEMQSYMDERSERWLESDAGNSYQEWKADWESAVIDECDIDAPEDIEIPDLEGADNLRSLESEPSS